MVRRRGARPGLPPADSAGGPERGSHALERTSTLVMSSKFSEFLDKNKIDPRRLVAASRGLERLRPEDRAQKLAKRRAKAGSGAAATAEGEEKKPEKRRSGRPVTLRLLNDAKAGKAVSGPAKTRVLRAVNKILEQKKAQAVELKSLF